MRRLLVRVFGRMRIAVRVPIDVHAAMAYDVEVRASGGASLPHASDAPGASCASQRMM